MRRRGVVATSVVVHWVRRRGVVATSRFSRDLLQSRLQTGEAERKDHAPVRDGVVEILPHVPRAVGVSGSPLPLHPLGKRGGVDFSRAITDDLRNRAAKTVPDGDCGEPVEGRNVDGLLAHLRCEALRLGDAPVLALGLPGGDDFVQPRRKRLLRKAGGRVCDVLAELAPQIRRLVRDGLHVGVPPRHVEKVALSARGGYGFAHEADHLPA